MERDSSLGTVVTDPVPFKTIDEETYRNFQAVERKGQTQTRWTNKEKTVNISCPTNIARLNLEARIQAEGTSADNPIPVSEDGHVSEAIKEVVKILPL